MFAYLIFLIIGVGRFAQGVYLYSFFATPQLFEAAYALAFAMAIVCWLRIDCARRGLSPPFDLGLLLCIAWPILLPYYLLKTRGWRAIIPIFLFVFVFLGATYLGEYVGLNLIASSEVEVFEVN